MPKYKLIYFNIRVRGEVIRFLFAAAGVPYEDYRIPDVNLVPCDEWKDKIQKECLFAQVPVLEVDGQRIHQSHAIERYLAREFGMFGSNAIENAHVDMWMEASEELFHRIQANFKEKDAERKEADKNKIQNEICATIFKALDDTLAKSKSGFIVGDKLSVADLEFLEIKDWILTAYQEEGAALLNKYKNVAAHMDRIAAIPAIADWIKKRPQSVV